LLPTQAYARPAYLAGWSKPTSNKSILLTEALKDDYAGKEAIRLFVQTYPAMLLDRIFEDMVQAVILHAPTITPTTSSLRYAK